MKTTTHFKHLVTPRPYSKKTQQDFRYHNAAPPAAAHYNDPVWRNVFPLPHADKFYDLLQDRLHTAVENILFQGDTRFTLLINSIDRKVQQRYKRQESPHFIYAGLNKQRALLNENALHRWGREPAFAADIEQAWNDLGQAVIIQENSEVSSSFYEKIKNAELNLLDTCKIQDLKSYFDRGTEVYTQEMQAERTILSNYFDVEKDVFIAAPLLGFAEFDGMVYIVFKRDLLEKIQKPDSAPLQISHNLMWMLLRAFIVEYDGLFLDWDMEGENIEKISAIHEFINSTILRQKEYDLIAYADGKPNQILLELRLREYYLQHRDYFQKRLESGEDVPGKIYQQYITHAVSAILMDSFAHNIGAHVFRTLAWWYFHRARYLADADIDWDQLLSALETDPVIEPQVLANFRINLEARAQHRRLQREASTSRPEDGADLIRYPGALARELTQFFRFLSERSTYWSGVVRDSNTGGKVSSLYSILWYDFINNPFFLVTIAKSEEIFRIRFHFYLYEPESRQLQHTRFHQKVYRPENHGEFAFVDLEHPRLDVDAQGAALHDTHSVFVHKGAEFDVLKERLKKVKIFFPGGVVGRHAFFTLIENEIRNVKHYNREALSLLRKNGLTVAIGIEPCSLPESDNRELYRASIWLQVPTQLGNSKDHLLHRRWDMLKGDIIRPETHAPRLGGSFQDKICAGFLFNGFFSHVQRGDHNPNRDKRQDTPRDRNYYPWVRPACSSLDADGSQKHCDYKISFNNPTTDSTDGPANENAIGELQLYSELPSVGYFKKVFYVWRGESLVDWPIHTDTDSLDNAARYAIVNLAYSNASTIEQLRRERGIVRIIDGLREALDHPERRFIVASTLWLARLLQRKIFVVALNHQQTPYYRLVLDARHDEPAFRLHELKTPQPSAEQDLRLRADLTVGMIHSTTSIDRRVSEVRFRSHGVFQSYFFQSEIEPTLPFGRVFRMLELFETLATKICIFDKQIYHRLRNLEEDKKHAAYHTLLRDQLNLAVFNESFPDQETNLAGNPDWLGHLDAADRTFVESCHFMVLHVSFIESIISHERDIEGLEQYNVGYFIERYIIPLVGQRDNFFLFIATSKGRGEWWSTIHREKYRPKGYASFVLFAPIESLLSAVENAILMQDDFELKYRVTKALYGS